jgi:hypothetical protein
LGTAKPTLDTSLFNCSDPAHAFELGKVEGQTLIVDALREALRHGPEALEGAVSIIIDSHDELVRGINDAARRIKADSERRAEIEEELRMCELSHWGAQGAEED